MFQIGSGKVRESKSVSFLFKAVRPANQLKLLKDSILIYRISRSAQRYVFLIGTDKIPPDKVNSTIKKMMARYRSKAVYDSETGYINTNRAHMSMLENFWFSQSEGKTTSVQTIGGDINVGNLEDLKVFRDDLYDALAIPYNRKTGDGTTALPGSLNEASNQDLRFYKQISRLRSAFSKLYLTMFIDYILIQKHFSEYDTEKLFKNIWLDFFDDTYLKKELFLLNLKSALALVATLEPYVGAEAQLPLFSLGYINREILGRTDADIDKIYTEIYSEDKEMLKMKYGTVITKDEGGDDADTENKENPESDESDSSGGDESNGDFEEV